MGPAIRGESGRGEVRDDVDVDFVAMLLRGEARVHDGDRASGAEVTPAAGPRADYRLRLTLDQWTPDGAVSGEITDITRLRLRFRSDYGTVTALDGSAVPQTQDLFRPLLLVVHRDDGSGIDGSTAGTSRVVISVVAERLDTPVRIPDTPDATGRRGMRFFADPELAYERGTFYLFATTDGHGGWSGWQIRCLASEDLTHWQDRGVVIDLHDQHLDGSGRTNILPGRTPTPGCRRSPFATAAITCISAATGRPTWRYPTISMEDTLCKATWREPARTPRGTASEPASSRPASILRRSAARRPADGT